VARDNGGCNSCALLAKSDPRHPRDLSRRSLGVGGSVVPRFNTSLARRSLSTRRSFMRRLVGKGGNVSTI